MSQHRNLQPTFRAAFQRYVQGIQSLSKANKNWFGILDRKRYSAKYAAYDRQFNRIGQQRRATIELALARTLTPKQKASGALFWANHFAPI